MRCFTLIFNTHYCQWVFELVIEVKVFFYILLKKLNNQEVLIAKILILASTALNKYYQATSCMMLNLNQEQSTDSADLDPPPSAWRAAWLAGSGWLCGTMMLCRLPLMGRESRFISQFRSLSLDC